MKREKSNKSPVYEEQDYKEFLKKKKNLRGTWNRITASLFLRRSTCSGHLVWAPPWHLLGRCYGHVQLSKARPKRDYISQLALKRLAILSEELHEMAGEERWASLLTVYRQAKIS